MAYYGNYDAYGVYDYDRRNSAYEPAPFGSKFTTGLIVEEGEGLPTSRPVSLEDYLKVKTTGRNKGGKLLRSSDARKLDNTFVNQQTHPGNLGPASAEQIMPFTPVKVSNSMDANKTVAALVSHIQPVFTPSPVRPHFESSSYRSVVTDPQATSSIMEIIEMGGAFRYIQQKNGDLSCYQRNFTYAEHDLVGTIPRSSLRLFFASIRSTLQDQTFSPQVISERLQNNILDFFSSPSHPPRALTQSVFHDPQFRSGRRPYLPFDTSLISPQRRHAYDPAKYSVGAQYPRYNPPAAHTTSTRPISYQRHETAQPLPLHNMEDDPFVGEQGHFSQAQSHEHFVANPTVVPQQGQEVLPSQTERAQTGFPFGVVEKLAPEAGRTVLHDPHLSRYATTALPSDASTGGPSDSPSLPGIDDITKAFPIESPPSGATTVLQSTESDAGYRQCTVNVYVQPDVVSTKRSDEELLALSQKESKLDQAACIPDAAAKSAYQDDLRRFWKSGTKDRERRNEHCDRMLAAGNTKPDPAQQAGTRALYAVIENLISLKESSQKTPADYFARYAPVPEWCVDRSSAVLAGVGGLGTLGQRKSVSLFGEQDWGTAPERVGRDPRYRHLNAGVAGAGGFRSSKGGRGSGMSGLGRFGLL